MPSSTNPDIDHVYKVIDKLDLAIDKLADVSSDIKQILAVHETRLDQTEALMDRSFVQMDAIHQRIGNLRDDMNKESEDIRAELSKLHQWKWMIMGGAAVVSSLISMCVHMPGINGLHKRYDVV